MTWPHVTGQPCDCASCTSSASPPLRPCSECLRALPPGAHWPACSRAPMPPAEPIVMTGYVTGLRTVEQHHVRDWMGRLVGRTRGLAVVDVEVSLHGALPVQTLALPLTESQVDELVRVAGNWRRTPRVRLVVEVLP